MRAKLGHVPAAFRAVGVQVLIFTGVITGASGMVSELTEKVYGMGAGNDVAWVTYIVVAKMPLTFLFIMRFGDVTSMQKEQRSCR